MDGHKDERGACDSRPSLSFHQRMLASGFRAAPPRPPMSCRTRAARSRARYGTLPARPFPPGLSAVRGLCVHSFTVRRSCGESAKKT
jgi:hypothetical protein